jgi:hypothetical protein
MDASEYLEALMAEGYKKEIDQEENVVRSLPFVAVGLALLSTIMIFIAKYIPTHLWSYYTILVWVMLVGFGLLIIRIIFYLYRSVSRRNFQYVTPANDLYAYATSLNGYYTALGRTPQQISDAVIEDMRTLMIQQYAIGARHNQAINVARSGARAKAFGSLVLALALAFAIVVTISVHEVMIGSDGSSATILD